MMYTVEIRTRVYSFRFHPRLKENNLIDYCSAPYPFRVVLFSLLYVSLFTSSKYYNHVLVACFSERRIASGNGRRHRRRIVFAGRRYANASGDGVQPGRARTVADISGRAN